MRYMLLSAMILGLVTTSVQAQTYKTKPKQNPAFAEVVEDPSLPRVLIIGDSISIGYTPALRELMKGEANVHRIPTNGGPTTRGVDNIESWLGDGNWDVIHFNWGLHDLVYMTKDGQRTEAGVGQHQVPIEQYEQNLRKLVKRLKETDAALIWRNTTPVPKDSRGRLEGEEKAYNEVAAKIMAENGIPVDDHHTFVMQHMSEVQKPKDVHFTSNGSARLAELAAKSIRKELKKQD
ncbi:SGNH/GDSL hydrolase family protein [Rubinisphaera margarita]|uniref:SGNH/GDSL hydrolase family protein n=1 Tax=Rubinisphaera margarita TaxID=2909586 RepID=UPI001EE7CC00|nr:SGNH/GDSL hydrolase family protein [Rubinisphaera margarita]MCG6157465.1 SGNH/GDSL hydrolase family protein [Rubinisphaera margarita]